MIFAARDSVVVHAVVLTAELLKGQVWVSSQINNERFIVVSDKPITTDDVVQQVRENCTRDGHQEISDFKLSKLEWGLYDFIQTEPEQFQELGVGGY